MPIIAQRPIYDVWKNWMYNCMTMLRMMKNKSCCTMQVKAICQILSWISWQLSIRSLYYPTLHLPSDFLLMHAWTNFSFSRCWLQFLKHLHMEKNHKFLTLFCVQAPNFSKKNTVFSQCTRQTSSRNCIYWAPSYTHPSSCHPRIFKIEAIGARNKSDLLR